VSNPDDAFQKLEEKVMRVAGVLKQSQEDNRALQKELDELKSGSREDGKRVASLEKELDALRKERDDVRARVERIIKQIDVLTTPEAGG